jgi:hypothetical protein
VRPARTHARVRLTARNGTSHRRRGTTPAWHMARRRTAGWPSVRPTTDAAQRHALHPSRRRVPGVATARRRFKSNTGRHAFLEERRRH